MQWLKTIRLMWRVRKKVRGWQEWFQDLATKKAQFTAISTSDHKRLRK